MWRIENGEMPCMEKEVNLKETDQNRALLQFRTDHAARCNYDRLLAWYCRLSVHLSVCLSVTLCFRLLRGHTIHLTAKVSEQVNCKFPLGIPFYNFQPPTPTLSTQTLHHVHHICWCRLGELFKNILTALSHSVYTGRSSPQPVAATGRSDDRLCMHYRLQATGHRDDRSDRYCCSDDRPL